VRYVALAAVAATFWLLVACGHLMVHEVRREPIRREPNARTQVVRPAPAGSLSRFAVVRGMNEVKAQVARCYDAERTAGMAMVNIVIAPGGEVSSATVSGRFAGSATGACVQQAVLGARFPASDSGLATPYPFQIR
jgi:hypothetical protein